jgi:hypothetical protein
MTRPPHRTLPPVTLTLAASLLALATASPAQFLDFEWTQTGDPSGTLTVTDDVMHIVGPGDSECTTGDTYTHGITTAPASGTVSAHLYFENHDTGMGWWAVENPVYVIEGEVTYVEPGDIYFTWEGDVSFHVEAGQTFGFGCQSSDCLYGPGILDVTEFTFTPDVWQDLDVALAGAFGEPSLVGLGTLEPGSPVILSLVSALPDAPAWLFVGFSTLHAPFKGGVLVPDPGPPGAVLGFLTSPAGRIILTGSWPVGVPSGTLLVMQYWIVDPAGPVGFAASNAVSATTP